MTDKIIQFVVKPLFYIFVLLLLVYLFVTAKQFGYAIFADEAKDAPAVAKEMILTVTEDEPLLQIGKDLAGKEIVDNSYIFAAALRCSEGYQDIRPGEYIVKSSQKPSEILDMLIHKEEQEK